MMAAFCLATSGSIEVSAPLRFCCCWLPRCTAVSTVLTAGDVEPSELLAVVLQSLEDVLVGEALLLEAAAQEEARVCMIAYQAVRKQC